MFDYKGFQWLFLFYFYCFGGWCFESVFVSLKKREWVNRGFMRGPFLPIYGSGAIMMLVVSSPFQDNVFLTYIAGVIGATALEYITGVTMEALFKVRYWDYSSRFLNYKGHICLGSSIAWGFFTILMTHVIHRPIERLMYSLPEQGLYYFTVLLTVYIVVDFTLSFKAALDIKDIMVKLEKGKEELERIQKRIEALIAFSNSESVREEIAELRGRLSLYLEQRQGREDKLLDFYKRDMIQNNPSMRSDAYESAFEELRKLANDKRIKKGKE